MYLFNRFRSDAEDRGNPRGIVPIWRARIVTDFKPELLPPEPVPLPVKDSLDSLIDIIDYLQEQYAQGTGYQGEEEHYGQHPPPSPEILIDIDEKENPGGTN